jgi:hypothetical protein
MVIAPLGGCRSWRVSCAFTLNSDDQGQIPSPNFRNFLLPLPPVYFYRKPFCSIGIPLEEGGDMESRLPGHSK